MYRWTSGSRASEYMADGRGRIREKLSDEERRAVDE
jgi:hypothetical protein